jgi:hypothetical protein
MATISTNISKKTVGCYLGSDFIHGATSRNGTLNPAGYEVSTMTWRTNTELLAVDILNKKKQCPIMHAGRHIQSSISEHHILNTYENVPLMAPLLF